MLTKVNRLILIGNGFDLAHNLKTSYNDFIVWYLTQALEKSPIHAGYEDELISVKRLEFYGRGDLWRHNINNEFDFVMYFYTNGFSKMLDRQSIKIEGWQPNYDNPYDIRIKSKLFKVLLLECTNLNWVDIENTFYDELKLALHLSNYRDSVIKELNDSLKAIIKYLEIYLATLEISEANMEYHAILESPIESREFLGFTEYEQRDVSFDKTMILNFNYTSTIEKYVNPSNQANYYINYIHGKLGDPSNQIIFGFGDELDKDYASFELDRTKGIFEYIKSFWYFKTTNYHDLIRFIEAAPFQVYTLGHSCGLSDRTMLNMIFEHENCRSIKIFYHSSKEANNYTVLTQEIARHFRNKQEMRRKIVPFSMSSSMPQVT